MSSQPSGGTVFILASALVGLGMSFSVSIWISRVRSCLGGMRLSRRSSQVGEEVEALDVMGGNGKHRTIGNDAEPNRVTARPSQPSVFASPGGLRKFQKQPSPKLSHVPWR
jgi:hypothetical protein